MSSCMAMHGSGPESNLVISFGVWVMKIAHLTP